MLLLLRLRVNTVCGGEQVLRLLLQAPPLLLFTYIMLLLHQILVMLLVSIVIYILIMLSCLR